VSIDRPLPFAKLEALGNDFVLIDARDQALGLTPAEIRWLADRHLGIGFDQLLVLRPAGEQDALCQVEIFNTDASIAEQCGNGMRAVALWLHRNGELEGRAGLITAGGRLDVCWQDAAHISISLPGPDFSPRAWGGRFEQHQWTETMAGEPVSARGLSLGNPHVVLEWPRRPSAEDVLAAGRHFHQDPRLSRGANISLAHVAGHDRIELAVHERGVGPTLACGSGACASAIALLAEGRVRGPVHVQQPGGELVIDWPGMGHPVTMTGPARHVFDGIVPSNQPSNPTPDS
jgi:diaminopimelate epimerase